MDYRLLVRGSLVAVAAFAGCNVYDSSLLTGGAGTATGGEGGSLAPGGSSGGGGAPSGGSGGSSGSGGQGGAAGSGGSVPPEGGAGGEDPGTGGTTTGGTDAGGGGAAGAAGDGGMAGVTGGSAGGGAGGDTGGAGSAGMAGGGAGGASGAGAGGGAGSGPIVQLSGTATADSEQTSPAHPATHGNDGMTNTRWCAANSATGHYWTLDLGSVHSLARFEVIWEYPSQAVGLPYGYLVSVSGDGTTFTPSIDRQTTTDTMQIQTSDFPPSASGRYVRITATSLPQGAWASFWEVRVFGQ